MSDRALMFPEVAALYMNGASVEMCAHDLGMVTVGAGHDALRWERILGAVGSTAVTARIREDYPAFPSPPPIDRVRDKALRLRLVARWPRITEEALSFAQAAGINIGHIAWNVETENVWHAVVREAVKARVHDRLAAMLAAAERA